VLLSFNPFFDRVVIEAFSEGHFRRKRDSAPETVFLRKCLTRQKALAWRSWAYQQLHSQQIWRLKTTYYQMGIVLAHQ
jgi:hypothetical protein